MKNIREANFTAIAVKFASHSTHTITYVLLAKKTLTIKAYTQKLQKRKLLPQRHIYKNCANRASAKFKAIALNFASCLPPIYTQNFAPLIL